MANIGRNDPCPCGSGKKYKNCCLEKDRQLSLVKISKETKDSAYLGEQMERKMGELVGTIRSQAHDLIYDGWETMADNPAEAKRSFQKALKLDPDLADAYNGLAGIAHENGNLKLAEEYYRQAYEKAKTELGTEAPKAFHWWGELDTRPYMRARQGLGLVLMETRHYDEAISEFKELLKLNSNDNQGIRYLVAPIYLLKGDIPTALKEFEWFRRHYGVDLTEPHYLLNWGLALFLDGQHEKAAIKFRSTIFANPYLIPLILDKKLKLLPIWHSTNLMELDYAYDYLGFYLELWIKGAEPQKFLETVWEDPDIQKDYTKWIEYETELEGQKNIKERRRIATLAENIEGKKPTSAFFKRLKIFLPHE